MKYVCIVILALLFAACNPYSFQKAYFVEPPVTATFDSARQTRIDLRGSYISHGDIQITHSFTNHNGMFASGMIGYQGLVSNNGYDGFQDKGVPNLAGGLSGGYIWYSRRPKSYVECLAGYGFQINNSRFYEKWINPLSMLGGPYFSQDVHSAFHRIIVQPSLFSNKKNAWGFSLRTELVYCPYYYYDYAVEFYDPEESWYNPVHSDYYDLVTFYNKWFFVLTPVFTYQNRSGKTPYGFYIGANFPSVVKTEFHDLSHYNDDVWFFVEKNHPTSASIIFGFEYSLPLKLRNQ